MSTTSVVNNYIRKFFSEKGADLEAIRPMLADEFRFWGPLMTAESADDFIAQLRKMAPIKLAIKQLDLLVDGDRAVLVFEFNMPDGPVAAAEWYRVRDGKIVEMKLHNDPRPFLALFDKN